jgi:hypothetical protein
MKRFVVVVVDAAVVAGEYDHDQVHPWKINNE